MIFYVMTKLPLIFFMKANVAVQEEKDLISCVRVSCGHCSLDNAYKKK